jgi:hypothetical protein
VSRYHDMIRSLEEISSGLDDFSLEQLREDLAAKKARSAIDRDLMRARRAVDKAAAILRQLSQDSESPEEI